MALILNDDQQMLKDSAREFLAQRAPVSHLRSLRDEGSEHGFSEPLWQEMAEMGWAGILVPEAHGGLEFGHVGMSAIMQELGHTLTPSPLFSCALMAASALDLGGSDSQKAELFPRIADGSLLLAPALEDPPGGRQCQAETTGEGWLINGEKRAVVDGHVARQLLVSARVDDELAVFLVPAQAEGVAIERTVMMDTHNSARVELNGVELNDGARLTGPAQDWLETVIDLGRIGQSAELLGIAETVLEMTLDYLRQRKQFGVTISNFQALQHRAAQWYAEIEMLKSTVLKAAQVADDGEAGAIALHASLAKAKASSVASMACNEAIQMHGGIGMTDEFDLGFFAKRARVLQQTLGDEYFHLDRFAKLNHY